MPSMPSVPLMRARPSLACSSTGDRPASFSATAAGRRTPSASVTSPSPISASAQCDSGARSPEQPSEPYSWTTGVMPWVSIPAIVRAVSRRMPVCPVASVESRSSISARVTSRSTSGPLPAACERTSERCSCSRISLGMWRVASAPNPVDIPYDGVLAAASASTVSRARPIAETASSDSSTGAPSRATATTSSKVSGPTPTDTVGMRVVWWSPSWTHSTAAWVSGTSPPSTYSSRIRDQVRASEESLLHRNAAERREAVTPQRKTATRAACGSRGGGTCARSCCRRSRCGGCRRWR